MRRRASRRTARAPQFAAQGSRANIDNRAVLHVRSPHCFPCKQTTGVECGAWKSQSKQRGGRAKHAPGGSCLLSKCAQLRIGKHSRAPCARATQCKNCVSLAAQRSERGGVKEGVRSKVFNHWPARNRRNVLLAGAFLFAAHCDACSRY